MIVVAIVGILAAIAFPAYQDYTVRAKVSEAVIAITSPKNIVCEAFHTDGLDGVAALALDYNARPASEKAIEVRLGPADQRRQRRDHDDDGRDRCVRPAGGGAEHDVVLTPNVQDAALAIGITGAIDWGCSSTSAAIAADRGLVVTTLGTLPAKYAPAECR